MEVSLMPQSLLLGKVRTTIRLRHYSIRTEEADINVIRRFILYHEKRHPAEMGADEIRQYLSHLATDDHVAASTQNVALAALLFLYREVLQIDLPLIEGVERAKRSQRIPVVLTSEEVKRVPDNRPAPSDGKPALRRRIAADGVCPVKSQRP
jgi:site-specific recombinase XerD